MPTQMPYGVSRFQKVPVNSPFAVDRQPDSRSPMAIPNSTGSARLADASG